MRKDLLVANQALISAAIEAASRSSSALRDHPSSRH